MESVCGPVTAASAAAETRPISSSGVARWISVLKPTIDSGRPAPASATSGKATAICCLVKSLVNDGEDERLGEAEDGAGTGEAEQDVPDRGSVPDVAQPGGGLGEPVFPRHFGNRFLYPHACDRGRGDD